MRRSGRDRVRHRPADGRGVPSAAVEGIRNEIDGLQGKAKYGFKLVDSGAGKLAGLVGVDPLIDVVGNVIFDQIEEALERRTHVGEKIVRWTVRVRRSEGMVQENLAGRAPDARRLDAELVRLCARYDKNMRWGRIITKGLKWCAPASSR